MGRCLDEGEEEFILKPVQISYLKKLRNYIYKFYKEGLQFEI
jgi:hypothetical protein